jgi:ACS family hexuronate transporter-like MFS transporter
MATQSVQSAIRNSQSAILKPAASAAVGHFRWVICALLFTATTINYLDRQVFGILAPDLQRSLRWNEVEYGYIVAAFTTAYAIGLLLVGRLMDRVGSRIGYAAAVAFWSVAAMAHALASGAFSFAAARAALGLGESGNFPVGIKTVAEWFPRRERAFATGLFNSGTNVGAIVAPLVVPFIALHYGWQWAFIATGAVGFLWLALWLAVYERPESHPRLSPGELAYIRSDAEEPTTKVAWAALLPHRQTWAIAVGKFMTDPIWWFYLFWLAKFLNERFGLTLATVGMPLVTIYLLSDIGSIGGGWLSSALIKRGWSVNGGRKTAMLVCAIAVMPIAVASRMTHLWAVVGIVGLATAAHQGWSANMFTLVSDMFPRRAVGSVTGIGGMAGAIGGILLQTATGYLLNFTGSYLPVFILASSAYLIALVIIHRLVPTLEPADVG